MTLVEILVVLAVIGLIMGGVAVVASGAFSDAQVSTAKSEVSKIGGYAEMYMIKKKKCPKSLKALKSAGIIKKVEKDPWDKEYKIFCENAVRNSMTTSNTPEGTSLQRVDDEDRNTNEDWTDQQTSTWGLLNAGQTPQ